MNPRRLYRSRSDRAITGIAGGMAEYLEVDPTIVRILWVLAAVFTGGLVILLYAILAFVIPLNPYQGGPMPAGYGPAPSPVGWGPASGGQASAAGTAGAAPAWNADWNRGWEAQRAARAERPGRAGLIIGTMLIVVGVIALADVAVPGWIAGALVGPALLLAIGAAILVASVRRNEEPATPAAAPASGTGYASTAYAAPATYDAPAAPPAPASAVADEAPAPWDPDATSPVSLDPGSDRS